MARSQMSNSKNPTNGARYLVPLETNMMRIVPRLTSKTRAIKISSGKTSHVYMPELVSAKKAIMLISLMVRKCHVIL
jgi:hypothetical protein